MIKRCYNDDDDDDERLLGTGSVNIRHQDANVPVAPGLSVAIVVRRIITLRSPVAENIAK